MGLAPSTQLTMLAPPPVHGFDDWWKFYPRKIDKGLARKAYEAVIRGRKATHRELLDGVMRYAEQVQGKDVKFIKHGATWLHAEAWANETECHEGGSYRDVLEEMR